jgi:multidrug resistance efflux pump
MRKILVRLLVALLVVIGGIAIWYVDNQRNEEHSVLSGFFESQPTDVSSRVGGKVSKILVNEGDTVHQGDILMRLDVSPDQSQLVATTDAALKAREQLQELKNGPRPEDILRQKGAVAEAQAQLAELRAGPRPQEIAEALAAKNAAWEHYAEALRGPTIQARAEAKADYDSAAAAEALAQKESVRYSSLYTLNAVSKQQYDQVIASLAEATANRKKLQEAWIRTALGTPRDELLEARESYRQAKSAYDLVIAGSRPEDIDAASARLTQAQAALDELLAGTRPEEVIQARLAYKQAEAQLQSARIDLSDRSVRAPYDSEIDSIPVSLGDLIVPGTPLLRIENPTDIWVRVYVPESELAQVTIGTDAVLRVDGIDGTLTGYVESVADHGEFTPANLQSPDERGKQVFAVRLRLKQPDAQVKSGMDTTVVRIGKWTP